MSHEKPIDLVYGLENLYDLMEEKCEEIITSERPVCDDLKKITQQYEQYEKIAEGGMKRIYKVFDKRLNRYVALARLHENVPPAAHDSFIREARLTALLEHPGIISLYNIGIDESDSPFFTMELKVGKNLGQIVKDISEGSNKFTLNSLEIHMKFIQISLKIHLKFTGKFTWKSAEQVTWKSADAFTRNSTKNQ